MTKSSIDEEKLNMEIRKFLKKVGITSQREIERAVRESHQAGKVTGGDNLKAQMTLEIKGIGLHHTIEDDITLG